MNDSSPQLPLEAVSISSGNSDPIDLGHVNAPVPEAPAEPTSIVPAEKSPSGSGDWFCPRCAGVEGREAGSCPSCGGHLLSRFHDLEDELARDDPRSVARKFYLAAVAFVLLFSVTLFSHFFRESLLLRNLSRKEFLLFQGLLAGFIVFGCAGKLLTRAWTSVRRMSPNLYTLVGLGVFFTYLHGFVLLVLAWLIPASVPTEAEGEAVDLPPVGWSVDSFFDSCALIAVLALAGELLAARTRARSLNSLRTLLRIAPSTARVMAEDGGEELRPVGEILPGSRVRVRPGEVIPVDGSVVEGVSSVDQSLVSGEPLRIEKGPGSDVLAGTENGLQTLVVECSRPSTRTIVAGIAGTLAKARRTQRDSRRVHQRLLGAYLLTILFVAVGTLAYWSLFARGGGSFEFGAARAVGVLVLACPVAVGIAVPLPLALAVRRGARAGLIVRDTASLERLGKVDCVLFDKTGTLTEGKPRLVTVLTLGSLSEDEMLSLAAAVERGNDHPIALAILWEAVRRKVEIPDAADVHLEVGCGVSGTVAGERVAVGSLPYLRSLGFRTEGVEGPSRNELGQGHSPTYVAAGDRCVGLVGMHDPIKLSSRVAVFELKNRGVEPVLLSGDHGAICRAAAAELGIQEVHAEATPVEKFAVVVRKRNETLLMAMCGDGVNDAPALAAADVGIAMGRGNPVAVTTAGLILKDSDLRGVCRAVGLARSLARTVRLNVILAFTFNLANLPIAAGALASLGIAGLRPVETGLILLGGFVSIVAVSYFAGPRVGRIGHR